jgi:hypothetical protein
MKATLAPTVEALSKAYALISERENLPASVIVVKRDSRAWGHFTPATVWSDGETRAHEIMVSGENLARGARAVLGTLLHEAAHAKNHADGVRGTDINGRHNKTFAKQAEAFGLEITEKSKSIGWSHTEVPDECAERWSDALALIEEGIQFYADTMTFKFGGNAPKGKGEGTEGGEDGGEDTPKPRNKNNIKATCKCENIIRLSQKVLAVGVTCKGCGEDYKEATK